MSERINDGGPAFGGTRPEEFKTHDGKSEWVEVTYGGLTIRDYFAAKAPPMPDWWRANEAEQDQPPGWEGGMRESDWDRLWDELHMRRLASWAFHYADAMIAAREGGKP